MNYQNIIEDKYTPQGLTIIEDNYFISAYKKHSPSRIYIYNKDKCLGKIILDNKAHVGGISYLKEQEQGLFELLYPIILDYQTYGLKHFKEEDPIIEEEKPKTFLDKIKDFFKEDRIKVDFKRN